MMQKSVEDSEQSDYKASRYYVFDDALGYSDEIKHMVEEPAIFSQPEMQTFGFSIDPGELTFIRKKKPDGDEYIFVRKATAAEKRKLYGG